MKALKELDVILYTFFYNNTINIYNVISKWLHKQKSLLVVYWQLGILQLDCFLHFKCLPMPGIKSANSRYNWCPHTSGGLIIISKSSRS